MAHQTIVRRERNRRQFIAMKWAMDVFGVEKACDPEIRAMRFLEEAIELAQTQGITPDQIELTIKHVYSRPVGELPQEIGGVMTALTVLAENAGLSVDECEFNELQRVLNEDPEVFREKQKVKEAAGLS